MDTTQVLTLVSIACDLVLFALFAWLYLRIRALGGERLEVLIDQLKESQELAERLQAIVEEKARIAKKLEASLETKGVANAADAGKKRETVVALHHEGKSVSEISNATGLSESEVEFILSVQKVSH